MAENAKAFVEAERQATVVNAQQAQTSVRQADAEPAANEHGLQTMFEYDPAADRILWSDQETAARILGVSKDELASRAEEFSAKIHGNVDASRPSAFAGGRASYAC